MKLRARGFEIVCGFVPEFVPKRLREVTRRDSATRQSSPTAQLELTGMTPQQTGVKEWE